MNSFDDDIDSLAVAVEMQITENQKQLDNLPDFTPRSEKAKKMRRVVSGE